MKRSLAFVALAACTLAVSVTATRDASAYPPKPHFVNDAAVLEGMPHMLSEFGFFLDASGRTPHPELITYELNTPLFSDGAEKLRYIYLPEGSAMEQYGPGLLKFPVGTAIIKTFAFGEGEDQRYIETRVLLHRADGWVALPYMWNEDQTEARLALAGGRVPITTPAGEEISYRIPNMNQCKTCHSTDGEITPIGPQARNLSRGWLASVYRDGKLDDMPEVKSRMPVWGDEADATNRLARAYLEVNCAHCHKPGGSASNTGLDLRWSQQNEFAIGIRKPPVAAGRGSGGLLVSIEPGKPDASILVHRMNSTEPGVAMPELGRSTIDTQAVALMREWIAEMDQ